MKLSLHKLLLFFAAITFFTTSCYRVRPSNGGGQISEVSTQRSINPADIALPQGYTIEAVATGLTYPTGITFDAQGRPYVVEAGYSYGEDWTTPQLLRLNDGGSPTLIAQGGKNGPWNGVAYDGTYFYVAEGGTMEGGRIIKISQDGTMQTLAENLPSMGDHHTNGPLVKDGYVYFTIGAATNSGVVGEDNAKYGWLKRKPAFHDIPCRDITLRGQNFETNNALNSDGSTVQTGAYVPYGTPTQQGQVIKGQLPCTGALLRVPSQGGPLELVAWGLRNPFGMAWSPQGELFVADNAFDNRGSRPVWGAGDVLWQIKPGIWYGWPDFWEGRSLQDADMFKTPGRSAPAPLLAQYPNDPPRPAAIMGVHSSSNGFDFSKNNSFGFQGQAFVAQFGDMAPVVGKIMSPVGYKIVRVNTQLGVIEDFATNKGRRNGPASWLKSGGFERPIAARFNPSGTALYVVDFGVARMSANEVHPKKGTGVVWKITRQQP